ncbi:hypothetical protein BGW41_002841 [Actinomortierella wolfii]|nr:hypothetical protein BGW41_002841 [Actinomortierella wolfii]
MCSSNFHNNSSSNTDKRRRIGDTTALRSNAHTSAHDSLLNSSDCVASGVAFCDKSTIITTKNAATMEARKKQEDKCDKETHGRQDAHPEGASLSNHMDDVDRLLATQDEELKVLFEVDDEDEDELLQDGEQQDAAMLENIASFERELEGCLSN